MSWYDYVPGVNMITGAKKLASGDYQGGIEDVGLAKSSVLGNVIRTIGHGAGDSFTEQANGMDKASNDLGALADRQRAFQLEGLNRAENYYAPAQAQLTAIYGPPGSMRK